MCPHCIAQTITVGAVICSMGAVLGHYARHKWSVMVEVAGEIVESIKCFASR
jgi:hypothetical protein